MSKGEQILAAVRADWTPAPELARIASWQPHTLRSFLSTAGRKHHLTIERKRENGVTSYRAVNGAA